MYPANQYSNKVDFVQVVKLKGKAKTAVTGKLVFPYLNKAYTTYKGLAILNIALENDEKGLKNL
jgi:hypothetical protein